MHGGAWPPGVGRRLSEIVILALGLVLGGGCQAQPPELSQAAAAFREHVLSIAVKLEPALAQPVARGDVGRIELTLEQTMGGQAGQKDGFPGIIIILDRGGTTLARHPRKELPARRFADYALVQRVLREQKLFPGMLYLPAGDKLYAVCGPVRKDGRFVGMLVLIMDAATVQQRWGLHSVEFLAINFNR